MTGQYFEQHPKRRVCMFVYNNFLNDSRVQKEAQTLIQAGYQVTVLALLNAGTKSFEERCEIRIIRVPVDPLNQRIMRWMQRLGVPGNNAKGFAKRLADYKNLKLQGIPFGNLIPLLLHCLIIVGVLELLYNPLSVELIFSNKFLVCGLICLPLVYRYIKNIKNAIISNLKKILMPFYRQFCFLSFYRNARHVTRKKGFDIYHAHDLNTLPVAYFSAKRDKAKLVYDSHELYTERNKMVPSSILWKFILSRIEGFLVQQSDAVFTVNKTLARELARRYNIPLPGVVMNTPASFGKNQDRFRGNGQLREKLSIPPLEKLLLYVGAITYNRGLEEMIQSLSHLPDCHLVFMGYGQEPFKQKLLDLVKKNKVDNRFYFFGPVPSDQVIHYAAGADLGVAPIANACLSYYYCSPNKLFEYMNAGLPVAVSNFPELEKVVKGHDIGVTFDPADPADISDAIRRILDDPEEMARMSNNAVKASGLYNWESESKTLLAIYKGL